MSIPLEERRAGIDYLKHVIHNGSKEKILHNILILFLSELGSDYELCLYLDDQEIAKKEKEKIFFSLEFALSMTRSY